jgi:hypothetical protein
MSCNLKSVGRIYQQPLHTWRQARLRFTIPSHWVTSAVPPGARASVFRGPPAIAHTKGRCLIRASTTYSVSCPRSRTGSLDEQAGDRRERKNLAWQSLVRLAIWSRPRQGNAL